MKQTSEKQHGLQEDLEQTSPQEMQLPIEHRQETNPNPQMRAKAAVAMNPSAQSQSAVPSLSRTAATPTLKSLAPTKSPIPVIIDSSTADEPASTSPSTGTAAPGTTRSTSPTCTSPTSTSSSPTTLPAESSVSSCAVRGASCSREPTTSLVRACVHGRLRQPSRRCKGGWQLLRCSTCGPKALDVFDRTHGRRRHHSKEARQVRYQTYAMAL